MTILLVTAFAMERSSCDGGLTSCRGNAPWTK
jgi:hypothetical protein